MGVAVDHLGVSSPVEAALQDFDKFRSSIPPLGILRSTIPDSNEVSGSQLALRPAVVDRDTYNGIQRTKAKPYSSFWHWVSSAVYVEDLTELQLQFNDVVASNIFVESSSKHTGIKRRDDDRNVDDLLEVYSSPAHACYWTLNGFLLTWIEVT